MEEIERSCSCQSPQKNEGGGKGNPGKGIQGESPCLNKATNGGREKMSLGAKTGADGIQTSKEKRESIRLLSLNG